MARDIPQAPIPMTMGMIQPADTGMTNRPRSICAAGNHAGGAATCRIRDAPNNNIPAASTRASPKRLASRPATSPWFKAETSPTIMKLSPTSRAVQA
ncbi:hypothetical protein D3C73_1436890 [compost metagenome]